MAVAISKQEARKYLSNVPEEHVFWCQCGRTFKNMQELADNLATISDEAFSYHVNAEKNDFANWVRDTIGDQKLAKDLVGAQNKDTAAKKVSDRISFLQKKSA